MEWLVLIVFLAGPLALIFGVDSRRDDLRR
jgi:hypothetical protein